MKVTELSKHWEEKHNGEARPNDFRIRLPMEDAARIHALADLYPEQDTADILNDMLAAALEDLSQTGQLKDRVRRK